MVRSTFGWKYGMVPSFEVGSGREAWRYADGRGVNCQVPGIDNNDTAFLFIYLYIYLFAHKNTIMTRMANEMASTNI